MRVVVMFDLPMQTLEDSQSYRVFRRYLIKSGFVMMQYSVYTKLALNQGQVESIVKSLRSNAPRYGRIQVATMTEKQFGSIEYLSGRQQTKVVDSDSRWIEL